MHGQVVMLSVGLFVDDAQVHERSIQEMQVLVAVWLLNVNGKLALEDQIWGPRLRIRLDFGDS